MKPIIDVHSHIFNAMDIPLKGYLLSRKFEGITKFLAPVLVRIVAKCVRDRLKYEKGKCLCSGLTCSAALSLVYSIAGKDYKTWVNTLSKEIEDITEELIKTFESDGIDLHVPLMIDYEYWFKNSKDIYIERQIDDIFNNIIKPNKGKIHPFVSFDPAREIAFRKGMKNPDGKPERFGSLNLVKDAINKKGFIGVKLYNAMGYKPFNNHTVDSNRRKIALHKKKYVFKGEEYDEVLSELYEYCIKEDIPITTHCNMDGSESYPDASFDFGQPKFWKEVLDQERFKKLRLNLAHFGWNKKQAYDGPRSWVKTIAEMLGNYENLYTDVSHHEVLKESNIPIFQSTYKILTDNYPDLKERLLFGIDWHVIKRVKNYSQFKKNYVRILKHNDLFDEEEIENFLGGNAIKFLGLQSGGKNRIRLKTFYQNNDITPPDWYNNLQTSIIKSRTK